MIEIPIQSGRTARIAHSGENEAVQVAFSLAPFQEAFPGGRPALLVRRKGDAQAYPATLTVEGDTAYWTVTAADTAAAGFGQCELQWYAGDTLAKSDKFDFLVVQALEAGAEPPDEPSKRWFDAIQAQIGDLDDLTTKAKENLVAAINEAAKTGSGGAGSIDMQVSGGYIQYSADDGTTWENLIAVADLKGEPGEKGEPGADGYSPSATVSTINGGARIVIEDKNGTTAATIMNGGTGPKGDPGDDGVTPNIQIGTVTTLDAGSDATASMSGTAENPLLNLGIPKGGNGLPGHTPEITATKSGKITTIKSDGTAIAEISDGTDGAPGKDGTNGTDGITPTIGDNGNWYLGNTDTGKPSRGPAGRDGAGMDITGAAAGQIAKISAVDENGKPTAWEPVDMPSGAGSTWVKVHEKTLAEPLESYIYQLGSVRAAAIVIAPGSDIAAGWKWIKLNTMDIPIANDKTGANEGFAVCIDLDAPIKMIATNNSPVKGITTYGTTSSARLAITAGDIDTINQIGIITSSLLIAGAKISIYTK